MLSYLVSGRLKEIGDFFALRNGLPQFSRYPRRFQSFLLKRNLIASLITAGAMVLSPIEWGYPKAEAYCGYTLNYVCECDENYSNCPSDCSALCGNGVCDSGENEYGKITSCPEDCGQCSTCGAPSFICDPGETSCNCPSDCVAVCGDGCCDYYYYENTYCPLDCGQPDDCPPGPCDHDCYCDSGETACRCPSDCVDTDNDGFGDGPGTDDYYCDNCPGVYNSWQWDSNGDGIGDACQCATDFICTNNSQCGSEASCTFYQEVPCPADTSPLLAYCQSLPGFGETTFASCLPCSFPGCSYSFIFCGGPYDPLDADLEDERSLCEGSPLWGSFEGSGAAGGTCVGSQCNCPQPCTSSTECSDGDACNGDEACVNGFCTAGTPMNCDDADVCNGAETCVAGSCAPGTPLVCDDGNACNGVETCASPTGCQPGTPLFCDDLNLCTNDACNPTTGCQYVQVPMDDGDACTTDACDSLTGTISHVLISCDDANICTDDSCTPATGCVHTNNSASCSDGDACTTGDACSAGTCVGGPVPNCDDGNPCTVDTCLSGSGCVHTPAAAGTACGSPSDTDCDNPDSCDGAGSCQPNYEPAITQCRSDAGQCDVAEYCNGAGSCPADGFEANGTTCDDGNACTTGDACSAGSCVGGAAPNCDDGNVCTDDSCNPATGCAHVSNTASCNDGIACTNGDTCSGGVCAGSPVSGCCETDSDCNDNNSCTSDVCKIVSGNATGTCTNACVSAKVNPSCKKVKGKCPVIP